MFFVQLNNTRQLLCRGVVLVYVQAMKSMMEARWSGMDADAGALGSHDFTCEVRSIQTLVLNILSNTLVLQPARQPDLRVTGSIFSSLCGLHLPPGVCVQQAPTVTE